MCFKLSLLNQKKYTLKKTEKKKFIPFCPKSHEDKITSY